MRKRVKRSRRRKRASKKQKLLYLSVSLTVIGLGLALCFGSFFVGNSALRRIGLIYILVGAVLLGARQLLVRANGWTKKRSSSERLNA